MAQERRPGRLRWSGHRATASKPGRFHSEQERAGVTVQSRIGGLRREVQRNAEGRVRIAFTTEPGLDATALAAALRRETGAEVRFDHGSRALYATDSSNYRQVPIGVVLPRRREDVVRAMAVCR